MATQIITSIGEEVSQKEVNRHIQNSINARGLTISNEVDFNVYGEKDYLLSNKIEASIREIEEGIRAYFEQWKHETFRNEQDVEITYHHKDAVDFDDTTSFTVTIKKHLYVRGTRYNPVASHAT